MSARLAATIQRIRAGFERSPIAGAVVSMLIAAAVFVPPIVYQVRHFHLGWADVGAVRRALYYFFEHGRVSETITAADGWLGRVVLDGPVRHIVPLFVLLSLPVRLFDTAGYEALLTGAMVAAAGYVFALARRVCQSEWAGLLCAGAYIANPYTYAVTISSHFESFGVLFLLAFAYHSYSGHTRRAWLMLALALLVKEDMWLYVALGAVILARRGTLSSSVGYVTAAIAYYVVIVHPAAHLLLRDRGRVVTGSEWTIAMHVLGRWRELPGLLFAGPGRPFQASFLFLTLLAGWRCLPVYGVLALWLALPAGEDRTELAIFYSFPVLSLSFMAMPFAMNTVRRIAARLAPAREPWRTVATLAVPVALSATIAADIRMHRPGHVPPALVSVVEPGQVYSDWPFVKTGPVRYLIARYLGPGTGSVMAQFYTIAAIRERPGLYFTGYDKDAFLYGSLRPDFVLLDLGSVDPMTPPWQDRAIASILRQRDSYEPISDADGVLLYRRREH